MRTDWIMEGTRAARERWHNLKYYTWVEQQGKTVQELDAQRDPAWWESHQQRVQDIDARLTTLRETTSA
jgi:cysteine synthase